MAEFQRFDYRGTNPWPKFIEFLTLSGYAIKIGSDLWPVRATHTLTGDVILAREVSERISSHELGTEYGEVREKRVLFVDYADKPDEWLRLWTAFAQISNIGVFDLHSGWVNMPGETDTRAIKDAYRRATLNFSEDAEGNTVKACRKCGEFKKLTEFYKKPRSRQHPIDPYRNVCKVCNR